MNKFLGKGKVIPIVSAPASKSERRPVLAKIGDWASAHRGVIAGVQWGVVAIYAALLILPAVAPLPGNEARILNNVTLFAEFVFWGIWWPFVLVSMVLFGRLWCGMLCPEGFLSEWASNRGLNRPIPRWMRWPGWPFVAFSILTIYGQLVSVYQYPYPALLILGGSTAAAMVVGWWTAKGRRAWCRYLCPVSGVFSLLSMLAPMHFKVDKAQWDAAGEQARARGEKLPHAPLCPPMLSVRNLNGNSSCHMCARCSGHRGAVELAWRHPDSEIVDPERKANKWQAALIVTGLLGIAIGAFHWTVSPLFLRMVEAVNAFLIEREIYWPLNADAPWWLLTNYPEQNDSMHWAYGLCVLTYILGTALVMSVLVFSSLALACKAAGRLSRESVYRLAWALIPLAAMGVFLGLSATTVNLLKRDLYPTQWANGLRLACLIVATAHSAHLGRAVLSSWGAPRLRRAAAWLCFALSLAAIDCAWGFMFWRW